MLEWCMSHPWMTSFLVFISLVVIEGVVFNICKTIAFYVERKYGKGGGNDNK